MTHTYKIEGMTCNNCVENVKTELRKLPEVLNADVNLSSDSATIEMKKHISTNELQKALDPLGKYKILEGSSDSTHSTIHEEGKTWFETYRPLIIIFIYVIGLSLLSLFIESNFNVHNFMNKFMAGFFIVFSFFKFLDLKGFAEGYSTYDLLAKKIYSYGYVYPFIELALGVAYLTSFNPFITNTATVIVMGFSSIGVIKSIIGKKKIKCACLGTIFNLPMTTITVIEDLLMVIMAIMALITS